MFRYPTCRQVLAKIGDKVQASGKEFTVAGFAPGFTDELAAFIIKKIFGER